MTLALIAQGIWIERSVWPLAGLALGFCATFIGMLTAGAVQESESAKQKTDGSAEQDEQDSPHPGMTEEEEQGEKKEEDSPEETLQWAAFWVGAVGAFRCWSLLSDSNWSDWFDSFSLATFDSPRDFILGLSGPAILIAAVGMYHARFYVFAAAACVLCLLSGSCPAVIVGVWSLITLFDPRIRALFLTQSAVLDAARTTPAGTAVIGKPPVRVGYGDALGSTISRAWTDWWRDRDALFTRVFQAILLLVHIACLLAFLSFSVEGPRFFKHQIGFPAPWFTLAATTGANASFSHAIHWSSPAWIVAAVGFAVCCVYCRIEKVCNPNAGVWYRPATFAVGWAGLALASIGLGAGLGQLAAMRGARETEVEPVAMPNETASQQTEDTSTLLMNAIIQGDINRVRELLDMGASVNEKGPQGQTLLMEAIAHSHRSLALTLVVLGADLAEQDQHGTTAMMVAVEKRDKVFLGRLRELSLVAFEQDSEQRKSQLRAFSGVERSLLAGRDYDLRNSDLSALERQADENGETASIKAVKLDDWDVLGLVAKSSYALKARDNLGRNIAMYAALNGSVEKFRPLDDSRYSGLAGVEDVFVDEMVSLGLPELALQDSEGKTALQHAKDSGHRELADILTRHLRAIVKNQTTEIEQGGDQLKNYELRSQAWQVLSENEKAQLDRAKAAGGSE